MSTMTALEELKSNYKFQIKALKSAGLTLISTERQAANGTLHFKTSYNDDEYTLNENTGWVRRRFPLFHWNRTHYRISPHGAIYKDYYPLNRRKKNREYIKSYDIDEQVVRVFENVLRNRKWN